MAGICGVFGINNENLVRRMVSLIKHRGEKTDIYADDNTAIALIRRSEEAEAYNNGIFYIATDADIYAIGNHLLNAPSDVNNYIAQTSSIEDTIKDLRGNFALVIIERGNGPKKLTLARDIFGLISLLGI